MRNNKKWLITSLILIIACVAGAGGYYVLANRQDEIDMDVDLYGLEWVSAIPFGSSILQEPILLVDGTSMINLTREQQADFIASRLDELKLREVSATHEDQELRTTLGSLGVRLEKELDDILIEIENLKAELGQKQANVTSTRLRLPFTLTYKLAFTHGEAEVAQWVQVIANEVSTPVLEPTISRSGDGFDLIPGRTGLAVLTDKLSQDLANELRDLTRSVFSVEVFTERTEPTRDQSLLESVDTMIATASTHFPTGDVPRSHNVNQSVARINGTLLMPGDTFSFARKIFPVNAAHGWRYATVFVNNRHEQGMGGGICQTSSTLYWAQLRTGIFPRARTAHQLPVGYVPGGLDATYWDPYGFDEFGNPMGGIDYQFVNTLDYPLYIHAFTSGGTLTVEMWSNANALHGLTFEPRSTRVYSSARATSYDVYLRTYRNGNFVSEQFVDRSTYGVRRPDNDDNDDYDDNGED